MQTSKIRYPVPVKVALVHELLTMKGGAEKVLRVFAEMFPDAPIYTFLYDEKKLGEWFPKERVRTSRLQKYARLFGYNHHLYLPFFPRAVEEFDFSDFDLVISSSSAFAHGIITNGDPLHLCYVHSPARYLWDRTHDVMARSPFPLSRLFHRLRIWDSEAADRPDMLLSASREVKRRIELYWRRESLVLYPPIDDEWLSPTPSPPPVGEGWRTHASRGEGYFLIVSTLARYKRIDLAIAACNLAGVHLKIVGVGPDMARLKRMGGPDIEFYGWRSGDELKDLYARAKATIIPGEEDFGLVALESLASGTPVIAYKKGGATETVADGKTGTFFDEPSATSLRDVIASFDRRQFQESVLRQRAAEFAKKNFVAEMHKHIAALLASRTGAQ